MAFKQLKKIDKRTQYSVYGWIRNQEKTLRLRNVPSMISSVCILYFRDDEIFDVIGDDIKLSENKKSVTKIEKDRNYANNSYGIIEISSMSNLIYQWDLKIVQKKKADALAVGIASNQIPNKQIENDKDGIFYVCGDHGHIFGDSIDEQIDAKFDTNDIVSIHLDLQKLQISFAINGEKKGSSFKKIQKASEIKYRLVVSLGNTGDCIEIINFTKK